MADIGLGQMFLLSHFQGLPQTENEPVSLERKGDQHSECVYDLLGGK